MANALRPTKLDRNYYYWIIIHLQLDLGRLTKGTVDVGIGSNDGCPALCA